METLTDIFGHVCGQNHCFTADGAALPVCQRCLGLYLAAVLTGAWVGVSGLWRRGLPNWGVFVVHAAALVAAMLAGLHVWGDGPVAKAACGLWTGHVALLWLVGAGGHLRRLSRAHPPPQVPWRTRDKLQALAAMALLAGLAALLPHVAGRGWWAWSLAAAAGALMLVAAAVAAAVAVATYLWALARR